MSGIGGIVGDSLVGADTGGFKSLGAQLFIFVRDEVNAERKLVDICSLTAKIEDADLWVGHTTVETRLWVWLAVKRSAAVYVGKMSRSRTSCSSGNTSLDDAPF